MNVPAANGSSHPSLDIATGLTLRIINSPPPGQLAALGFTRDGNVVSTIGSSGLFAFEVSTDPLRWQSSVEAIFCERSRAYQQNFHITLQCRRP